jgi:hypothetical protein
MSNTGWSITIIIILVFFGAAYGASKAPQNQPHHTTHSTRK